MALQTKSFSVSNNTYTLKLTITENGTSTSGNSSSVSYKLELISTSKDFYNFGVGATIKLDGRVVATRNRGDASSRVNLPTNSSVTLLSGSTSIGHDNSGSKTLQVVYSIDMAAASYTPGPMSGSGSMPLTKIPRGATITNAPYFTDEDNPVIRYSNPAGTTMEMSIKSGDESKILVEYRVVTGSTYTFRLTQSEREALQKYATKNTATVVFVLRSVLGSQTFFSTVSRTLTIKNPAPTVAPVIEDVNPLTVALTGDPSVMVRYASNAQVITGAQAVKFATLASVKVTCGSKSINGDGTLTGVEFGSFKIEVTDSRGNTTTATVKKTLVEYVTPTCYIGEGAPNALGEFDFSTSGTAWNGDFGADVNTLVPEYRLRIQGGEWSEWIPMLYQTNGNSYTATVHIEGLDYTAAYEFQGRITDKLNTFESAPKTVTSIPVFDFGPNDFNFNVPIYLTKHKGDGTKDVRGLARCSATARISQNLGQISTQTTVPLGQMIESFGGAELYDGGVRIANDGFYLLSAAVHYTDGADKAWCGASAVVNGASRSVAYSSLAGGSGTVVSPPSIVKMYAGDIVHLRAEATGTVSVGNDYRTRLTVVQIY